MIVFTMMVMTTVEAVASTVPNLMWLQTDSMDGRLLDPTSPYYRKLKLRGIKSKLVDNGVTFARHYCASPQCVPSRASLMTGRYVHEIDTTNNGQGLARSTKTGRLDSTCVKVRPPRLTARAHQRSLDMCPVDAWRIRTDCMRWPHACWVVVPAHRCGTRAPAPR